MLSVCCLCSCPSSVSLFFVLAGQSVSCRLSIAVWSRTICIDQPPTPCWDTPSSKIWPTRGKFASCSKIIWTEQGRRKIKVRRTGHNPRRRCKQGRWGWLSKWIQWIWTHTRHFRFFWDQILNIPHPLFSRHFRCSFQTFEPQILLAGWDSSESEKGQFLY